jgi:CheY-like chemotaxis protein
VTLDASIEEPNLSQPLIGTNEVTQRAERTLTEKGPPVFLIASVADSGVGLTEEEQRNLFQKFSQASPRTHIEYGGSGLGLFISRALVEVQGGRISLESEKDKGTTLTFYIAAQKVAAPPKKFDVPAASTPSISLGPGIGVPNIKRNVSSTSMMIRARSTNVLVVEDNLVFHLEISLTKINQKLLIRQLQLAGFRTAVANHGVECLDMLASGEKFDIVLMDLEMPVLDGFSAASEIRRRESAGELDGRIPIIAVTGNARREYIDKGTILSIALTIATSIGIDSFIVKPYEKQDLLDKVRALTEV